MTRSIIVLNFKAGCRPIAWRILVPVTNALPGAAKRITLEYKRKSDAVAFLEKNGINAKPRPVYGPGLTKRKSSR